MMSSTDTELESWLGEQVAHGDITLGAAVTVMQHGRTVLTLCTGTDARGVPVEEDSMFSVRPRW